MTTPISSTETSSTSTPSSSPSQSSSDTATLYLFTFLATILILVLLSASLVLRSYILRRRYRRRFQRALSDTLFVDLDRATSNGARHFDPLRLHRPPRRLGPKPLLRDTWIHPVDEDTCTWSSFTPVAVRCYSSSTLISSPPTPSDPSSSHDGPLAILTQLRLPGNFSLTRIPSSRPAHSPSPVRSSVRSPPPIVPTPPNSDPHQTDASTLAVCVFVAMPDVSAPVHRPVPDAKGKGVDTLDAQAPQRSGDINPLVSPSPHRSGPRIPAISLDELPLLEFGIVELKIEDWAWQLSDTR